MARLAWWIAGFVVACALCAAGARAEEMDAVLLARATSGDAGAQLAVGEAWIRTAAGEPDPDQVAGEWKQAVDWIGRAAAQAYLPAELRLAELYRDGGKGLVRDTVQSAHWYRVAAEQGDTGAQGTLGLLYSIGQGVPHNDTEAYFWLAVAADAPGPHQQQYAANRQNVGMHITADELAQVNERLRKWRAAHPRPTAQ